MARKRKMPPGSQADGATPKKEHDPPPSVRRNFIVEMFAIGIGAFVGLVPLVVGAVTYLNPLRAKEQSGEAPEDNFVRITTLMSLPPDGRPYRFPVIESRTDAWNVYPDSRVGSVYLRRTATTEPPTAYTATCPHLGCMIDYKPEANLLVCPCHNSAFEVDGARVNPATSPSPRNMDELAVEIRNGDEIWVNFERFRGGVEAKEVV